MRLGFGGCVFDSDTRVDPLHARKMCAALQAATSASRPIVFRRESEPSAYAQWRLVESSDALIGEHCAAKRTRFAIAEERRRMRFQAH